MQEANLPPFLAQDKDEGVQQLEVLLGIVNLVWDRCNTKHYILPLGMANRMRLRMRIDSLSQSHALSWRGRAVHRAVEAAA